MLSSVLSAYSVQVNRGLKSILAHTEKEVVHTMSKATLYHRSEYIDKNIHIYTQFRVFSSPKYTSLNCGRNIQTLHHQV